MSAFLRGMLVVTEKNVRIYYLKAPIIIFGLMFPLFMFLAFYLGRDLELSLFLPGFLAMALFFTASSVGPLITPWEKNAGTYERLLSFPVSINTVIMGDVVSGAIYGLLITLVVIVPMLFVIDLTANALLFPIIFVAGSLCFASLGVLLASPSVKSPPNIMMFSSLVRFPLIFISGVFIPLNELQGIGRYLSYLSPLTYLVDAFNFGTSSKNVFPIWIDIIVLIAVTLVFILVSGKFHKKNMMKGL